MSDTRMGLEEIFDSREAATPAELVATPERDEAVDPATQAAPEAPLPEPDATPAEAAPEPDVAAAPTSAERNDWKAEAIREKARRETLESELNAFRAAQAAPKAEQPQAQPQQSMAVPDPVTDPAGFAAHQELLVFNARADMSEMLVRQQHADVDEKLAAFQAEVAKNPALAAEIRRQPHPWKWVYDQGARALAQKEIGDDPAAYRAKVEAEVRAKLEAEMVAKPAAPTAPSLNLPPNLTGLRSSAPRGASAFTGPTPLEALFPN